MFTVKIINYKDTYSIRNKILRPGKPLASCFFDGDENENSYHFGIFEDEKDLIGVASFFNKNNENFNTNKVFQLRGMAVLDGYQGKGVGANLLIHAEAYMKNFKSVIVWCNARSVAIPFYKKIGYQTKGSPFQIPEVGEHMVMYKLL